MKNKITLLTLICLSFSLTLLAQVPTPHASAEVRQKARDRSDYSLFRRQISATKEFAEERKKIPALQKENKEPVKVVATIDSVDTDDTTKMKTITGYITQNIGDNSANAYELTFDRTTRKITNIRKTGESAEPEAAAVVAPKAKTAAPGKPDVKKATPKKKKDGDEEEEEEEKEEKEEKTPASKEKDD